MVYFSICKTDTNFLRKNYVYGQYLSVHVCFNDAMLNHLHVDCLWPYLIAGLLSQQSFGNADSIMFQI